TTVLTRVNCPFEGTDFSVLVAMRDSTRIAHSASSCVGLITDGPYYLPTCLLVEHPYSTRNREDLLLHRSAPVIPFPEPELHYQPVNVTFKCEGVQLSAVCFWEVRLCSDQDGMGAVFWLLLFSSLVVH
ncbi:hypothetical protein KUCAC02_013233, partial [Chaenocephalus aceratus]